MTLPPSRRDTVGPPPRSLSDLAAIVRHHDSYLRQLDPGLLGGRFDTPRPVVGGMPQVVGGGSGGGEDDEIAWEWGDRLVVTATGTQVKRLTYEPIEESLFVRWHPDGGAGLPVTDEDFTLDGQLVTIPDPGYFTPGEDFFSFQYQYVIGEDAPEPSYLGITTPGTFDSGTKQQAFPIPGGVVAGDFLVLSLRGQVAPGGGEMIDGLSCADPRMTLVYTATGMNGSQPIIEKIWVGFEDGSGVDVQVDVTNPAFPGAGGRGVLTAYRGVNGVTTVSATESGTATPVVDGIAAVAVVWERGTSFGVVIAASPTGYTDPGGSGSDYCSTDIGWWYDPDADTSPTGTFAGEGCCVIGLT